ncbi:MAG: ABC transporter permease [Limisphaerales bacterium]
MQTYLTLTRRELGHFFLSFMGYIVIASALFLMGLSFVSLASKLQGESTVMPVTEIFFGFYFWLILLFSVPVITMRLFSIEKATGTFETLMTTPVSDVQVVMAKFTAGLLFYMVVWLPLLICIFFLRYFTHEPTLLDPTTIASTYLGIALLGMLYISLGCFASSLTKNQIVAAMVAFAIGFALFALSFLADQLSMRTDWSNEALKSMSIYTQMLDFSRGVVDSRYVVFYVSASAFFLFLTYRVVESRRWK